MPVKDNYLPAPKAEGRIAGTAAIAALKDTGMGGLTSPLALHTLTSALELTSARGLEVTSGVLRSTAGVVTNPRSTSGGKRPRPRSGRLGALKSEERVTV